MSYIEGLEFTDRNKLYERIRELELEVKKLNSKISEQKKHYQKLLESKRLIICKAKKALSRERDKSVSVKVLRGVHARFLKSLIDRELLDWNKRMIAEACFLSYRGVREALKDAK